MKYNNLADEILHNELPLSIRSTFVPIVSRAYELTYQLIGQHDFLQWSVGFDIVPIIRRVVIEHQFKKMIDNGVLPLKCEVNPNKIDNCSHIEMITSQNGIITVSQVRHYKKLPRRACFRENLGYNNYQFTQTTFLDIEHDIEEPVHEKHYILLTHGYSGDKPSFVFLGIPKPNAKGWLSRINLLDEPSQIITPKEDIVTEELLVELKQELISLEE
jgi:hypothetical protein